MDVSLVPFDAQTASPEEWARFHRFRRLRHEEANPGDPLEGDDVVELWLRKGNPETEETRIAAFQAGEPEMIGWMEFSVYREDAPSYENRAREARVGVQVLAPNRRKGIGRRLLAKAAALARERGKSILIGMTEEADGFAFVDAVGAQVALRHRESRLYLDQVDWAMVEGWAEEGPKRSPESTLQWVDDRVPDDILEEWCEVLTESLNEAPRGELEMGDTAVTPEVNRQWEDRALESKGHLLGVLSREANGAISGITLFGHWPAEKPLIHQFITGVRPSYRGRGLGKWLKAANLLRLRRDLPDVNVVVTQNATINAGMLSINERLGFQRHKEGIAAQMSLDALEAYLKGARS